MLRFEKLKTNELSLDLSERKKTRDCTARK